MAADPETILALAAEIISLRAALAARMADFRRFVAEEPRTVAPRLATRALPAPAGPRPAPAKGKFHCNRCDKDKPRAGFAKSNSRASGVQRWCRQCHRDYLGERRERRAKGTATPAAEPDAAAAPPPARAPSIPAAALPPPARAPSSPAAAAPPPAPAPSSPAAALPPPGMTVDELLDVLATPAPPRPPPRPLHQHEAEAVFGADLHVPEGAIGAAQKADRARPMIHRMRRPGRAPALAEGTTFGCWTVLAERGTDRYGRRLYSVRAACCGREEDRGQYALVHASSAKCQFCMRKRAPAPRPAPVAPVSMLFVDRFDQGTGSIRISYKETRALVARVQSAAARGERDARALDLLVRGYIGLVHSIARKVKGQGHLCYDDLVQEGTLGLLHAIERYDLKRNFRLTTYATWWIRHHIWRAFENAAEIRLPVHRHQIDRQRAKARRNLAQKLGHEPSLEEQVAAFGPRALSAPTPRTRSLDEPVRNHKGEHETTLADLLADDRNPVEEAIDDEARAAERARILAAIATLPAKHQALIRVRYLGAEKVSLWDTGHHEAFVAALSPVIRQRGGLTRERVRQLEIEALIKLRKVLGEREAA